MALNTVCSLLLVTISGMDQEFYQNFRAPTAMHPAISRFGPNLDKVVQQGPHGLQINLAPQRANKGAVGVQPQFSISGDFEITLTYEVLTADAPRDGLGVGVKLWGKIESGDGQAMTLAHVIRTKRTADQYVAMCAQTDGAGKRVVKEKSLAAKSRRGRLRLTRAGTDLRFQVAEGETADFQVVQQTSVGRGDVTALRISANTSDSPSGLNVRLADLRIRADRLPSVVARPNELSHAMLIWLLAGSTVGATGFAVWRCGLWPRRHRQRAFR